jgi:hypothetical protein
MKDALSKSLSLFSPTLLSLDIWIQQGHLKDEISARYMFISPSDPLGL